MVALSQRPRAVVAVAASAGGVDALRSFVRLLPKDLDACVLVVLHIPASGPSVLPDILTRSGALSAHHPREGERLARGAILVAPPDRHLVVGGARAHLDAGPRQSGHRPSGDLLLSSVAKAFGARAAGVVLSGTMDDGAIGLSALRAAGGLAMVQEPSDAAFPGMPAAAIEEAHPQVVGPIDDLVERLVAWVGTRPAPEDGGDEMAPVEMGTDGDGDDLTAFTCPDCGGTLWVDDAYGVPRFRCRVGHAYTASRLWEGKKDATEAALWAAIVALSERAEVSDRVAERLARRESPARVERYREDAHESRQWAQQLRRLVPQILVDNALIEEIDEEDIEVMGGDGRA